MLDRHIDIFDYLGIVGNLLNQTVRNSAGVTIQQTQPADAVYGRQFTQQRVQRISAVQIFSVACGVLCDETKLAHAERRKIARFLYDFTHRT